MAVNGLSWKVALVLFVFSLSVNAKTIYGRKKSGFMI